jgi:hypothetical protein
VFSAMVAYISVSTKNFQTHSRSLQADNVGRRCTNFSGIHVGTSTILYGLDQPDIKYAVTSLLDSVSD